MTPVARLRAAILDVPEFSARRFPECSSDQSRRWPRRSHALALGDRHPSGDTCTPIRFTALFDGKDLSGWRGRPGVGGGFSPYVEAKFTPEERAAKQKEWNAGWR